MTESSEPPPEKNGATALAKLLNQLNIPTIAIIALFGGGNFLATKTTSNESRTDVLKALAEIHDMHSSLDDFERRSREALAKQDQIIQNQQQLISQLHLRNSQ